MNPSSQGPHLPRDAPCDLPLAMLPEKHRIVFAKRYVRKDEAGEPKEEPETMFWRIANVIAAEDARYGVSAAAVEEVPRSLYEIRTTGRFEPNSLTLMNVGWPQGQLSACFVLPVEDALSHRGQRGLGHPAGAGAPVRGWQRVLLFASAPRGRRSAVHHGGGVGSRAHAGGLLGPRQLGHLEDHQLRPRGHPRGRAQYLRDGLRAGVQRGDRVPRSLPSHAGAVDRLDEAGGGEHLHRGARRAEGPAGGCADRQARLGRRAGKSSPRADGARPGSRRVPPQLSSLLDPEGSHDQGRIPAGRLLRHHQRGRRRQAPRVLLHGGQGRVRGHCRLGGDRVADLPVAGFGVSDHGGEGPAAGDSVRPGRRDEPAEGAVGTGCDRVGDRAVPTSREGGGAGVASDRGADDGAGGSCGRGGVQAVLLCVGFRSVGEGGPRYPRTSVSPLGNELKLDQRKWPHENR